MGVWLKFAAQIILLAAVVLIAYNLLKRYVLYKIKANKWVVLVIAIITFFIPVVLQATQIIKTPIQGTVWSYLHSGVFVILFLWYMDLMGLGSFKARNGNTNPIVSTRKSKDKKDNIIIKPKAKPNRATNAKDPKELKASNEKEEK